MAVDSIAIAVRALGFVAMLQAVGIFMFTVFFAAEARALTTELRSAAKWIAVAGMLLVGIHQLLEAARMAGTFDGILQASLQQRALLSATGLANGLRVAGLLAIIVATAVPGRRRSQVLGLLGGLVVAVSFAATGHTSIHPLRALLAPLLALHLWVAAFWFGALWPLYRATRLEAGAAAAIVDRFSRLAVWMVPAIAVAGIAIALAIVPTWEALWTPYGLLLSGKLLGFVLLMGLAALNKLRLGPALAQGSQSAGRALRCSLILEFALIVAVLAVTATMTAMFSPTTA
jgi:putative copper resistance protein D